jgi:hypothetical protein
MKLQYSFEILKIMIQNERGVRRKILIEIITNHMNEKKLIIDILRIELGNEFLLKKQ